MEAAIGLKPLKIGNLVAKHPVIQGGMGVGVSLSSLAGAVAKAGGIGIISTAQIGFKDQDFGKNPMAANLRAIHSELKKARDKAPQGILGFNIMVATKEYASYVKEAVKAGADVIISGAGLPIDMPKFVAEAEIENGGSEKKERRTMIAPIVSSVKSALVICRMWDRKYHTAPDFVVVEGPCAEGVQAATRFVTTEECDADIAYKEAYINAKEEDIVIVKSPVGMPGRAIKNKFLERVAQGPVKVERCFRCLEHCNPAETPYCITKALINAAEGKIDEALLFCGSNAYRCEKIETVPEVMAALCGE